MTSVDRRSFLKCAAGAAGLGMGFGAAARAAGPVLSFTPGTYTAKAAGISSEVTVRAAFEASRIADVAIDVSGETKGIGAEIGDVMAKRILSAQDCSVDGVSGASVTSNAVKSAMADCMSQASGRTVTVRLDVGPRERADPAEAKPARVIEAEAVVIGCGAAGLQAALTLQAAGIRTRLLEKGLGCGVSNGAVAGGPALAATRVQEAENAAVSEETLYLCQYGFSRGTVDGLLLRRCISQGERVVSNFMENGVRMGLRRDAYGMGFRARHNFANAEGKQVRGAARFQPLVDRFTADGGVFEAQREALRLIRTGEAVTGVLVRDTATGECLQYNARAVLVATGGYAGSPEMIREHFGDIRVMPLCNTLSNGAGYRMVIEAGGVADRNWALCCNEFGGANAKSSKTGYAIVRSNGALRFAIYGGLIVDPRGERFMNEQYLSDRPLALGGEMSLRVGRYYAVIDETMYKACRDQGILAYFGHPRDWYVGMTGYAKEVLPKLDADMQKAIDEKWAVRGTLSECAAFFGLNKLEKTVAQYNALCAKGKDSLFFKSPFLMRPLEGNTFWVVEYEPSIWCTFGGVRTDSACRAVTPKLDPIPGLYVAGVDNGSLCTSPYYENEGAALGTSMTSGIVAADAMRDFIRG